DQLPLALVRPHRADRLVHRDVVAIDPNAGLRLDRLGDIARRDAAEQPALFAGVRRDREGRRREALGDLFGLGLGGIDTGAMGALEALDMLDAALGGLDGGPGGRRG